MEATVDPSSPGSRLDADHPENGVLISCLFTDAATGFYYVANEYIPDPTEFPRGFATNWGTFITRLERTERTLSVSTK
jgi:hypothetical protein